MQFSVPRGRLLVIRYFHGIASGYRLRNDKEGGDCFGRPSVPACHHNVRRGRLTYLKALPYVFLPIHSALGIGFQTLYLKARAGKNSRDVSHCVSIQFFYVFRYLVI